MVTKSIDAKKQIIDLLRNQGYATYARLLQLFDVYLTDDPNTVAAMIPQKAAIILNENVDQDSISMLVRHEILHEYLTHLERRLKVLQGKDSAVKNSSISSQLANIAGDFEISNLGYTDEDKKRAKAVELNGKILRGLVTEIDRPGWENLTFEEMYEKLLSENEENIKKLQQMLQKMQDLDQDTLNELEKEIQDAIDQLDSGEQQAQGQSQTGRQKDSTDDNKETRTGNSNGSSPDRDEEEGRGRRGFDSNKNNTRTEKSVQELEKASRAVDQMQDTLAEIEKKGRVFDDRKDVDIKIDIETRVREIKNALQDIRIKNDLLGEVQANKAKEKQAAREYKERRYARSGLRQFTISLLNFVKKEVEDVEDYTYAKINPTYARDGFIIPALGNVEAKVPVINVYHDVSGSFSDPAKTEGALRAIESIQQYVRQGLLKVNLYYVTDNVYTYEEGKHGYGGASGEAIIRHVKKTKPDNVIVITDSDADDCSSSVTVPGAVWLLFYDNKAPSLITHLKGKKESRHFMIDYMRK